MEFDVIGYDPHSGDLLGYEPSIDAHTWETREARYAKKFEAARNLFRNVFMAPTRNASSSKCCLSVAP
jgi:hypothetical protein